MKRDLCRSSEDEMADNSDDFHYPSELPCDDNKSTKNLPYDLGDAFNCVSNWAEYPHNSKWPKRSNINRKDDHISFSEPFQQCNPVIILLKIHIFVNMPIDIVTLIYHFLVGKNCGYLIWLRFINQIFYNEISIQIERNLKGVRPGRIMLDNFIYDDYKKHSYYVGNDVNIRLVIKMVKHAILLNSEKHVDWIFKLFGKNTHMELMIPFVSYCLQYGNCKLLLKYVKKGDMLRFKKSQKEFLYRFIYFTEVKKSIHATTEILDLLCINSSDIEIAKKDDIYIHKMLTNCIQNSDLNSFSHFSNLFFNNTNDQDISKKMGNFMLYFLCSTKHKNIQNWLLNTIFTESNWLELSNASPPDISTSIISMLIVSENMEGLERAKDANVLFPITSFFFALDKNNIKIFEWLNDNITKLTFVYRDHDDGFIAENNHLNGPFRQFRMYFQFFFF